MLLPIRHENMSARRWPVVTLGLIALNTVIFLVTHYGVAPPSPKLVAQVPIHILILAAEHPELNMSPEIQHTASYIRDRVPQFWAFLRDRTRPAYDAWEMEIRELSNPDTLQGEMDSLSQQWLELCASVPSLHYGFIPSERTPFTYVTANFLHGSWLHLIGNMWFLWLAGFVLEDTWGRIVYAIFYLVAGALALQFYAWTNPESFMPLIGASGAVAGLMGAFLVRFPRMKIEMSWLFFFRVRYRFKAPAYCLLPLWLLMEVFYGYLFGTSSPVAHWAHVGGFVLGGLAAFALRLSNLEHKLNKAIEQKTSWTCDPVIDQATDLMEKGQLDEAMVLLNGFAASHPDSLDAFNLIQQICFRKGDMPAFREASLALCALHLKAREWDLAWQCFQELRNTSNEKIPANLWFDLCRAAENLKNFPLALDEYQQLAAAYPADRQSFMSQVAAGRICLSQLQRPQEALNFFKAAAASPVPHLDWEQTIQAGIRNAQAALAAPQSAAPAVLAK
ncbi:MAG TPA: rhomboid family intramembrane serine protease [Candidatus Angelobacter sp.]